MSYLKKNGTSMRVEWQIIIKREAKKINSSCVTVTGSVSLFL